MICFFAFDYWPEVSLSTLVLVLFLFSGSKHVGCVCVFFVKMYYPEKGRAPESVVTTLLCVPFFRLLVSKNFQNNFFAE